MTEPFYADRYLAVFDQLMRRMDGYEARIYLDDTLAEWLKIAARPQSKSDVPEIHNVIVGLTARRREMKRRHA